MAKCRIFPDLVSCMSLCKSVCNGNDTQAYTVVIHKPKTISYLVNVYLQLTSTHCLLFAPSRNMRDYITVDLEDMKGV